MADQVTHRSHGDPAPDSRRRRTADTLVALARRREDPDPEVRRGVAETLETLARTRPTVVLATVQRWLAEGGPHTQTVVRPALHVLARNGDDGARRLLGFAPEVAVRVRDVVIESDHVRTGEALRIRARVVSAETRRVAVSIDAAVDDLRPIIVNTRRLDPLETLDLRLLLPLRSGRRGPGRTRCRSTSTDGSTPRSTSPS